MMMSSMRILAILFIVVNILLFALGQGFFGLPPSEQGRSVPPAETQPNPDISIENLNL